MGCAERVLSEYACADHAQNDERMLTGSGDQCVHLWDTKTAKGVGQFRGHNGSVKSICPHPLNPHVFASGEQPSTWADALAQQPLYGILALLFSGLWFPLHSRAVTIAARGTDGPL